MAKYLYRARNLQGEVVRGEVQAPAMKDAKKNLTLMKLIPLDVSLAEETKPGFFSNFSFDKISSRKKLPNEELLLFFQQMQTIYAVGVPLLRGLTIIEAQSENAYLKSSLKAVHADISEGKALSEALGKFPDIFDTITISLLKAGESTGQLDIMLERIAKLLQQRLHQQAKIESATFYPKIVGGMILLVFGVVVYVVIPKFLEFFAKFGGELPLPTRIMVGLSQFMISYWYLIAAVSFGCVFAFKKYTSRIDGKRRWNKILLKLPIFGSIFLQNDMLSFCCIFGMLIRSGIHITQAIPIVRGALANVVLQEDLDVVRGQVEAGKGFTNSLGASANFPKTMTSVLSIGEEAGSMEVALDRMGSFYQTQVDQKLDNLSKVIEPILLVVIFGMVLLLALAVFMPMWKMNSLIKR